MKLQVTLEFDLPENANFMGDDLDQIVYDRVLLALLKHYTIGYIDWDTKAADDSQTEEYRVAAQQLANLYSNWSEIVNQAITKQSWSCKEIS